MEIMQKLAYSLAVKSMIHLCWRKKLAVSSMYLQISREIHAHVQLREFFIWM
jgi:hypothetical protein